MGGERKKPEGCCLPAPVLGRGEGEGNVALGCVCPALSIVGDVVASSLPLPSAGACSDARGVEHLVASALRLPPICGQVNERGSKRIYICMGGS